MFDIIVNTVLISIVWSNELGKEFLYKFRVTFKKNYCLIKTFYFIFYYIIHWPIMI